MRNFTFILIIITLLAPSCYKDSDNTTVVKKERPPHIVVNTQLFGTYASENLSNSNLIIKIGDDTFEGIDGQLPLIKLQAAQKRGEFIEFFVGENRAGAAQVVLIENDINYTNLLVGDTFSSNEITGNSEIDLDTKLSVNFVEGLFSDVNGQAYTSPVFSEHNFSEDALYNDQLVSFAFDRLGDLAVLDVTASFFMSALADDGTELDLAGGELLINSEFGDDEQLYHFNKVEKSWEYISDFISGVNAEQIQDLGWFVIAKSIPARFLNGNVQIADHAIVNQKVALTSGAYGKHIFTTSLGRFGGYVPMQSGVELSFVDRDNQSFFQDAFSANQSVDNISISLAEELASKKFIRSDFHVIDCEGNLSVDKLLSIIYDNGRREQFALSTNEFSWVPVSKALFTLQIGNGPAVNWSTSQDEIHYLSNCFDHSEGFSVIKIREDKKVFPAFGKSVSDGRTIMQSEKDEIRLIVEGETKGSYDTDKINLSINDSSFGKEGYFVSCDNAEAGCGIQICEITHYKADGDEWNRIYFKGVVWMQTIEPARSGNFAVEGYILSKQ